MEIFFIVPIAGSDQHRGGEQDYASVLDLIILNNLEFLDAMLIQWNCDKEERKGILQGAYDFQYPLLKRSATLEKLKALAAKSDRKE